MNELVSTSRVGVGSVTARSRKGLRSVLRLALDFALPQLCPSCREPLGDGNGLCAHCWSRLSLMSHLTARGLGFHSPTTRAPASCRWKRLPIHRPTTGRAVVRYDDISRALVHSPKYGDRLDLSPMMGRWLARAGRELLVDADALVPVPLHWRRLWARRFNQSRWPPSMSRIFPGAGGAG